MLKRVSTIVLSLAFCGITGCVEPSPCEKEARRACAETAQTVAFFNGLEGREKYSMEDCLRIIPLRCSLQESVASE